jgi:dimethylhistidine N-methyltransferase
VPHARFTFDDRLPTDYALTTLRDDAVKGLSSPPYWLPSKWLYDDRGSQLFDEITTLPGYYPARAEREILNRRSSEIAAFSRAATLLELGSGYSRKTRILLNALTARGTLRRVALLDINRRALQEAGAAISADYRDLAVGATVTDFEAGVDLTGVPGPRMVAFLGSTLGNYNAEQRQDFYRTLRAALSSDDVLLLGVDLVKDVSTLVRAYDDERGVTADFNMNLLQVLNRELGADFDSDTFGHVALWNSQEERIEMRLRSRTGQTVTIPDLDLTMKFSVHQDLRTEISTKFRPEPLAEELARGGFAISHWWTDQADRCALLVATPS